MASLNSLASNRILTGALLLYLMAAPPTVRAESGTVTPPPAGPATSPSAGSAGPNGPAATTRRELPAVRFSAPPALDGDLTDPCWATAPRADRFTDELYGNPVPDQTVAYLGYDDRCIYVGFHAFDSRPQQIVARQTKRGASLAGDDTFTFSIDTFDTHKADDRSSFSINPRGTQVATLASGRGTKLEWEGAWKSAARITPDGWSGEMAIPWSILNYPAIQGPATCGINFNRNQQRTQVSSWWSNVGVNGFYNLDGQWAGVQFPGFTPRLSLLPYFIPAWGRRAGPTLRSGLDARYTLTPALTAVGTLYPDFATVEQAIEGIDFSYGERFVPDRRPFFQEGADLFNASGAFGPYFYTQRIPTFEAGGKLYGKLTDRDTLGLLSTIDFGRQAAWFLRARHELGPTADVNAAFLGQDTPGGVNPVLVLGEDFRRGFWNANTSWAGTWKGGFTGSAASATFSYQSPRWGVAVAPRFITPGFHDELGLIPFTGFHGFSTTLNYQTQWRTGPLLAFTAFGSLTDTDRYPALADADPIYRGTAFQRQKQLGVTAVTRSNYALALGWNGGRFLQFDDSLFQLTLLGRVTDPFHNYGLGIAWGRQGGAPSTFITPSATWKWGAFTLGLSSAILNRKGVTQQHILTYGYDFSPRRGIVGRLVAQTGGTGGYLAYRQSGYGGIEQFLILGDPNAPKFTPGLSLKVIWPW